MSTPVYPIRLEDRRKLSLSVLTDIGLGVKRKLNNIELNLLVKAYKNMSYKLIKFYIKGLLKLKKRK